MYSRVCDSVVDPCTHKHKTQLHTHTQLYMHIRMHMQMHIRMLMHIHRDTHTKTHTHTHTKTHTQRHTHIDTHREPQRGTGVVAAGKKAKLRPRSFAFDCDWEKRRFGPMTTVPPTPSEASEQRLQHNVPSQQDSNTNVDNLSLPWRHDGPCL